MTVPVLQRREEIDSGYRIELSVLSKSDGSASWQDRHGSTVISSVNGPTEVRIRDEILGEATLDLKILPGSGLAGTRERYMESTVQSAIRPSLLLGLHPRSLIQMTSQVVAHGSDSASTASAAEPKAQCLDLIAPIINSIVLASADAGISMNCMLAAAVVKSPDFGSHVACYSFPKQELLLLESQGPFKREQIPKVLEAALRECILVHDLMRAKIEEKVVKDNRWRGDLE